MRLIERHDVILLGGLAVALFVVFSQALAEVFDFIQEIERSRGLRLLPALLILAGVFVFHQIRKRHQIQLEALGAARQATERVADLERLVVFGEALARSLNEESIQIAATAHIPLLAAGRGVWVLVRTPTQWKPLIIVGDAWPADCERAAVAALAGSVSGAVSDGFTCFPMIVAGTPIGVLGVASEPELTERQRGILSTAAALLGVSLKNAALFREVHENSVRDALTGCFNRRHALEVIDGELRRARRSQMPLSMIMFDLDHFKRINDQYGHLAGDAVLAEVGARMKAVLRGSDLKCRYGGEEFLILLPDTPLAGACHVAETLRRAIEEQPVIWNETAVAVTASFGVTPITPGEVDALVIMARADQTLYRAKNEGRNCVRSDNAEVGSLKCEV